MLSVRCSFVFLVGAPSKAIRQTRPHERRSQSSETLNAKAYMCSS